MPLSTKRYFCGGCGAVVEGAGRFCGDECVAKARASVHAMMREQGERAEPIPHISHAYTVMDIRKALLTTLRPDELAAAEKLELRPCPACGNRAYLNTANPRCEPCTLRLAAAVNPTR